ncbi:MAG: response regulator [Caldilineaceae bacterium]
MKQFHNGHHAQGVTTANLHVGHLPSTLAGSDGPDQITTGNRLPKNRQSLSSAAELVPANDAPVPKLDRTKGNHPLESHVPTSRPKPAGTVLIIDNNVHQIQGLMDELGAADFSVLVAQSGTAGYQRARLVQPDLILLEVLLPDGDGFAVCRQLKADAATAGIPILLLTALTTLEAKLTGFGLGAADYISKPLAAAEVVARVHTHIHLRRLTLEQERQRLGRELHDSVTQSLYSLLLLTSSWQLLATQGRFEAAQAAAIFAQLNTLVQGAYQEIRLLIHQLRPPVLTEGGLVDALQQRLAHVEQRAGLETQLLTSGDLDTLRPPVVEQLFGLPKKPSTMCCAMHGPPSSACRSPIGLRNCA